MAKQERVSKKAAATSSKRAKHSDHAPVRKVDVEALKSDMDSILDEIDLVLEQNAEEFVRSYVQKGGE